jgi:hypothetical protein
LFRGIFDKEAFRKALAVVGAAMELRARLGIGEGRERSGNERRKTLLCEVGMHGRGNCALCAQTRTAD